MSRNAPLTPDQQSGKASFKALVKAFVLISTEK